MRRSFAQSRRPGELWQRRGQRGVSPPVTPLRLRPGFFTQSFGSSSGVTRRRDSGPSHAHFVTRLRGSRAPFETSSSHRRAQPRRSRSARKAEADGGRRREAPWTSRIGASRTPSAGTQPLRRPRRKTPAEEDMPTTRRWRRGRQELAAEEAAGAAILSKAASQGMARRWLSPNQVTESIIGPPPSSAPSARPSRHRSRSASSFHPDLQHPFVYELHSLRRRPIASRR